MTKSLITIQVEVTEEEAELWKGRAACIGPMSIQEWTDLFSFFANVDGYLQRVVVALIAMRKAAEAGQAVPDETLLQLLGLAEDAEGVATLMPAIQQLMGRFALLANAQTKKGRVQ